MFSLWCEWDCGQEDIVFTTEEKAKNWFNSNINNIEIYQRDIADDGEERAFDETPFDYYDDCGLAAIIALSVDPQ